MGGEERLLGKIELPTVLRAGPYRFFFYSSDGDEPVHVHVERGDLSAKFWLEPVRVERAGGFDRRELGRIEAIVRTHSAKLVRSWHEFFNG